MTRTLADMTPAEQAECVGMWADIADQEGIIRDVWDSVDGVRVKLMFPAMDCFSYFTMPDHVTPRFDLPRAWTPDGKPVPGTWDADEVAAIADNISAASHGFPPEWQGKLRTWAKRLRASLIAGAAALETLDRVRDALTEIDRLEDDSWAAWERDGGMFEQGSSDAYFNAHTIITEALGDTP